MMNVSIMRKENLLSCARFSRSELQTQLDILQTVSCYKNIMFMMMNRQRLTWIRCLHKSPVWCLLRSDSGAGQMSRFFSSYVKSKEATKY